ncbi:hypothetical protein ACFPOI_35920 [Nonomuraea angiospora]|uniref:Uncharacterized protein n=1 Tax=Nonomuraea angiospora TaxID=46172 RepID=A0ABR9M8R9_9ACTN|nr:hypothetical protein [Nonomuraea angiospora]MBE1589309.1 hypothetical protein [Nonomuraea angiospora]
MNGGWHGATNVAMDDAHVDAQIGYLNGNVTIYTVAPSDPPQRKYQVGLAYLNGDMPRRAEQLIEEAAMHGHESNEVAYYWVLATLSDRTLDHLGEPEFAHLAAAGAMAVKFPRDPWRQAFEVVTELTHCIAEDDSEPLDDKRMSAAIEAYQALPRERQDEIHRHLEMVMGGWIQDRIEALERDHVKEMRVSGRRRHRVWKFFEPVPEPPRKIVRPRPVLEPGKRFKVISGAVLGGLGVVWMVGLMAADSPIGLAVVLALAGAWLIATFKVGLPQRSTDKRPPPTWRHAGFGAEVSASVDRWFDKSGPSDPVAARQWQWASTPVRAALAADLLHLYGGDQQSVGPIRWLIKWYARNAAQQFHDGVQLTPSGPPAAVVAGNAALVLAGLIALVGTATASFLGMLGVSLLLGLAAAMAWSDTFDYLAAVIRHPRDNEELHRRFIAEQQEYERWSGVLADRPTDSEMAAWLDYDKMMIKSQALKDYGLSNRDVIAHLTLTEADDPCLRARVRYGPLRYSAYKVLLFLLTEGGVRQVTVRLDFATATTHDEERTTFRYEMIASARVVEASVRFEHGRRQVMTRDKIRPYEQPNLVFRRAFQLSLVNASSIEVLMDNYEEGLIDRVQENINYLYALALDVSGVTGALRILEAVSAEGREWLTHERDRRRRRLRDFRESQKLPGAVGTQQLPMILPGMRDEVPTED